MVAAPPTENGLFGADDSGGEVQTLSNFIPIKCATVALNSPILTGFSKTLAASSSVLPITLPPISKPPF